MVALQRPRRARRGASPSTATSSPRCSSSRSPRTWAWCPPAPGFLERLRARCTRARRAARVRRGDHRLPGRRSAAPRGASASRPTCRSSARSSAAACRSRRSAGRADGDGRSSRRSARCTRPARCRGTRSRPRPGLAVLGAARPTTRYAHARGTRRARSPTGCATRSPRPAFAAQVTQARHARRALLRRRRR